MRTAIAVIGLMAFLVLNGCAQIKLNCPASGPQMTASVTGPDTVGTIAALTSIIAAQMVKSGVLVAAKAPTTPAVGGTLTYSTLAFTNSPQTVSCGPVPSVMQ